MKNVTILGKNPTISSVVYKTDTNEIEYAVVKLQCGGDLKETINESGEKRYLFTDPSTVTVTAYKKSYINDGADPLYDIIEKAKAKGIPVSSVERVGTIVQVDGLVPYKINDIMVTSDKMFVPGELTEGSLQKVMRQRKRQFADAVSETTETRVVERREIAPSI
jgi:hypothetical protein